MLTQYLIISDIHAKKINTINLKLQLKLIMMIYEIFDKRHLGKKYYIMKIRVLFVIREFSRYYHSPPR